MIFLSLSERSERLSLHPNVSPAGPRQGLWDIHLHTLPSQMDRGACVPNGWDRETALQDKETFIML